MASIFALQQQFAAPQIGRLKRQMAPWMIGGGGPQRGQEIRGAIRGYGEGLSSIMAGAGEYGQRYGSKGIGQTYRTGSIRTPTQEATMYGPLQETQKREKLMRSIPGWAQGRQRGGRVGIAGSVKRSRKTKREKGIWSTRKERTTRREREWTGIRAEQIKLANARRHRKFLISRGWKPRAAGGRIKPTYKVGEKGPELVKYDSGRFELVGKKGPEIRTFAEKGTVIPAGKTKKMMKSKSLYTSRRQGGRVKPPTQQHRKIGRLQTSLALKKLEEELGGSYATSTARRRAAKRDLPWKEQMWRPSPMAEAIGAVPRGSWMLSKTDPRPNWYQDIIMERQHKLAVALVGAKGGAAAKPKSKKRSYSFIPATA